MHTAVLVIDVQQGLCEGEGAAFDCDGTIFRINLVTRKARAAGALVIFIQHESTTAYLEHGYGAFAHHNATLTNISSFGTRAQAVTADNIKIAACGSVA